MIKGIGLDLCSIRRMEALVAEGRFLTRYFTPQERAYILAKNQAAAESAAGIFAAKEAFLKAIGTGLGGASLTEIEVAHTPLGQPVLQLTGKALATLGEGRAWVSITHEGDMAAATVIIESQN